MSENRLLGLSEQSHTFVGFFRVRFLVLLDASTIRGCPTRKGNGGSMV